jgi:very-short-patch-repair endonuclease
MKPPKKSGTTVRAAKKLRREMTPPEVYLWQHLRAQTAVKIRRQHPIGPYILDFFCPKAKLAIEVDGIVHDMGNNPERDVARDIAIAKHGIQTIRIPASDVLKNSAEVAGAVVQMCLARTKD